MQNKIRIQRASRRLRYALLAVIFMMPVVNAMVWLFINQFPEIIHRKMLPYFVSIPLPESVRFMGFIVTMMPIGITILGAYHLMRLFQFYEQGSIFRAVNVRCFKKLSWVLIWWFVIGIVHKSLLSVALTLHNPPGQRMLTLELGSPDLTALLVGCVLAVIAWVMEEGRRLQEEQDLTV